MLKEIGNHIVAPINRFFVVSVGLLGFIAARVFRGGAEYPLLLIGGLVAAAVGALVMVALDAQRGSREVGAAVVYTLIGGLLIAAVAFVATWLLVVPAA